MGHDSDGASIAQSARMVTLCREVFDDQTLAECGKRIVAWALCVDGGPTVTVRADRQIAVWRDINAAVHALDAFVDGPHNTYPLVSG